MKVLSIPKNHLHHPVLPRARRFERLLALRERKRRPDQPLRLELPYHAPGEHHAPRLAPASGERRVHRAHLAGDEAQAVAMESAAEIERLATGPVPRAHDDAAIEPGGFDRLIERGRIARELVHEIRAVQSGEQRLPCAGISRIDSLAYAPSPRQVPAR